MVPPAVIRWDRLRSQQALLFGDGNAVCTNSGKWATAVADHPGARTGELTFGVEVIKCDAGIAWGFVDARRFHAAEDNLGTAKHSWGVSRTGKRSLVRGGGATWEPFCEKLSIKEGDLLGATADLKTGSIIFFHNGEPLGEAYTDVLGSLHSLTPAVCTGSTRGGSEVVVKLVPWPVPVAHA
jgi:hypothetical protein